MTCLRLVFGHLEEDVLQLALVPAYLGDGDAGGHQRAGDSGGVPLVDLHPQSATDGADLLDLASPRGWNGRCPTACLHDQAASARSSATVLSATIRPWLDDADPVGSAAPHP